MRPYHEICRLTVTELTQALESGTLSSADVTQAYLDSISAQNGTLNAYLEVFSQTSRAR